MLHLIDEIMILHFFAAKLETRQKNTPIVV